MVDTKNSKSLIRTLLIFAYIFAVLVISGLARAKTPVTEATVAAETKASIPTGLKYGFREILGTEFLF